MEKCVEGCGGVGALREEEQDARELLLGQGAAPVAVDLAEHEAELLVADLKTRALDTVAELLGRDAAVAVAVEPAEHVADLRAPAPRERLELGAADALVAVRVELREDARELRGRDRDASSAERVANLL